MPRSTKSQWDFGELFPAEQTLGSGQSSVPQNSPEAAAPPQKPLSVSELTRQIKRLLELNVGFVRVTGEITNLRIQSSGHAYFTIKDAGAQLSCVLFRGERGARRELLEDGQKVLLGGDVTVYEARGQYQLVVRAIELQGVGALQAAFEKLKQKLLAEGLFAAERKRPLPRFPQRIGVVTSPTGAAIRDVLHVIRRRNPSLEIVLAPCRVQGDGAAREIADAIRNLNEFNSDGGKLDLILVTRGGGSLEDLWAFNEEIVARTIFDSALPIVSAVGHEIDFTISDFVADVRAATPSAAAEIITEGVFSSCEFVSAAGMRIRQLFEKQLEEKHEQLMRLQQRLAREHPRRRINDGLQRLDDLQGSLRRCAGQELRRQQTVWRHLADRLLRVRPAQLVRQRREVFEQELLRLREQARHRLRERQDRFAAVQDQLRLLGPEQVLARGYSITTDAATGRVLRDASKVAPGQLLKTRLQHGSLASRTER